MLAALIKALFLNARYHRRAAIALEKLERLYRLELEARHGLIEGTPGLKDEVEISYGPKPPADPLADPDSNLFYDH